VPLMTEVGRSNASTVSRSIFDALRYNAETSTGCRGWLQIVPATGKPSFRSRLRLSVLLAIRLLFRRCVALHNHGPLNTILSIRHAT